MVHVVTMKTITMTMMMMMMTMMLTAGLALVTNMVHLHVAVHKSTG